MDIFTECCACTLIVVISSGIFSMAKAHGSATPCGPWLSAVADLESTCSCGTGWRGGEKITCWHKCPFAMASKNTKNSKTIRITTLDIELRDDSLRCAFKYFLCKRFPMKPSSLINLFPQFHLQHSATINLQEDTDNKMVTASSHNLRQICQSYCENKDAPSRTILVLALMRICPCLISWHFALPAINVRVFVACPTPNLLRVRGQSPSPFHPPAPTYVSFHFFHYGDELPILKISVHDLHLAWVQPRVRHQDYTQNTSTLTL